MLVPGGKDTTVDTTTVQLQSSLPTPSVGEVLDPPAIYLQVNSSTDGAALAGANVQFNFGVEYTGVTDARGLLFIGLGSDSPWGSSALVTVSLAGYTTKSACYVINPTPEIHGVQIMLVPGGKDTTVDTTTVQLQSSLPTPSVGEVLDPPAIYLQVNSSTDGAALAGANVQFNFGVEYTGVTDARGLLFIGLGSDSPW